MKDKCVVMGCTNQKHEGEFNGKLCSPCFQYLVNGRGIYSQAYRNDMLKKSLKEFLSTSDIALVKLILDEIEHDAKIKK